MKIINSARKYPIYYEQTLASTNDTLKAMSREVQSGCAIIAARQTAGKGRLSRSFLSPEGGLYMSVLYRPEPERVPGLTAVAAVAVRRAIREECGIDCMIKWPNDLICEGRKLCGILTETVWRDNRPDVIIGIGVDLNAEDFPEELRDKAVSVKQLTGEDTDALALAEKILLELDGELITGKTDADALLAEYEALCLTVGRRITADGRYGTALGIGKDYSLTVRFEDGSTEALRFGEVSVRGVCGYV